MTVENHACEVAVVGGGPAGAQCALWLHKLGVNVVLFEKEACLGGLQRKSPFSNSWLSIVPHDALARDVASSIEDNLRSQGVAVRNEAVNSVKRFSDGYFIVETAASRHVVRTVVLATGTRVRVSGKEDGTELVAGLENVGPFDRSPCRVAIFGGGDAAYESWTMLKDKGHEVDIFARNVRANRKFIDSVPSDNVHVGHYEIDADARVAHFEGESYPFDAGFVLYGWEPVLAVADGLSIRKDSHGHVVTDGKMMTSVTGCFAIGDIVSGLHPCVSTALGSAAQAAMAIETFLGHR